MRKRSNRGRPVLPRARIHEGLRAAIKADGTPLSTLATGAGWGFRESLSVLLNQKDIAVSTKTTTRLKALAELVGWDASLPIYEGMAR